MIKKIVVFLAFCFQIIQIIASSSINSNSTESTDSLTSAATPSQHDGTNTYNSSAGGCSITLSSLTRTSSTENEQDFGNLSRTGSLDNATLVSQGSGTLDATGSATCLNQVPFVRETEPRDDPTATIGGSGTGVSSIILDVISSKKKNTLHPSVDSACLVTCVYAVSTDQKLSNNQQFGLVTRPETPKRTSPRGLQWPQFVRDNQKASNTQTVNQSTMQPVAMALVVQHLQGKVRQYSQRSPSLHKKSNPIKKELELSSARVIKNAKESISLDDGHAQSGLQQSLSQHQRAMTPYPAVTSSALHLPTNIAPVDTFGVISNNNHGNQKSKSHKK